MHLFIEKLGLDHPPKGQTHRLQAFGAVAVNLRNFLNDHDDMRGWHFGFGVVRSERTDLSNCHGTEDNSWEYSGKEKTGMCSDGHSVVNMALCDQGATAVLKVKDKKPFLCLTCSHQQDTPPFTSRYPQLFTWPLLLPTESYKFVYPFLNLGWPCAWFPRQDVVEIPAASSSPVTQHVFFLYFPLLHSLWLLSSLQTAWITTGSTRPSSAKENWPRDSKQNKCL